MNSETILPISVALLLATALGFAGWNITTDDCSQYNLMDDLNYTQKEALLIIMNEDTANLTTYTVYPEYIDFWENTIKPDIKLYNRTFKYFICKEQMTEEFYAKVR